MRPEDLKKVDNEETDERLKKLRDEVARIKAEMDALESGEQESTELSDVKTEKSFSERMKEKEAAEAEILDARKKQYDEDRKKAYEIRATGKMKAVTDEDIEAAEINTKSTDDIDDKQFKDFQSSIEDIIENNFREIEYDSDSDSETKIEPTEKIVEIFEKNKVINNKEEKADNNKKKQSKHLKDKKKDSKNPKHLSEIVDDGEEEQDNLELTKQIAEEENNDEFQENPEIPLKKDPKKEKKLNKKRAKKRKLEENKKIYLSWKQIIFRAILVIIATIAISALLTYFVLRLGPEVSEGKGPLERDFIVFFLNFVPIFLTMIILDLPLRNVFYSAAATSFIWVAAAIANTLKVQARDEPLALTDITLLKEAMDATGNYSLDIPWGMLAIGINAVLLLIFIGYVFRPQKSVKHDIRNRIVGTIIVVLAAVGIVTGPMASSKTYQNFDVETEFNITGVYDQLGFPYCFTYYATKNNAVKPDGYSKSEAESYETEGVAGQGNNVNVIFMMNEAFTDLTDQDVFNYPDELDPIANFHALSESDNAYSGHIVVDWFGGGTANTEYDVTTGMQTTMLSSSSASAFRYVKKNADSIFRVFGDDGYRTVFMHPGKAWFYNRENVYERLGAQEEYFADDMENLTYKGEWVTDDSTVDNVISMYEETVATGQNLFMYVTTIQNHMSYDYSKYGSDYTFHSVYCTKEVSYDNRAYLPVYIEGLYDADASLKKMTDYLQSRDEPTVLVFFGDHYPSLGDARAVYKELGLDIGDETGENVSDPYCAYEIPYLVWCNDAAKNELDFNETVSEMNLPKDGNISANYLGASILELLGKEDENSFFSYLNEMRRKLPIVSADSWKTIGGKVITKLDDTQQALVDKLNNWSYYRLTDAKIE